MLSKNSSWSTNVNSTIELRVMIKLRTKNISKDFVRIIRWHNYLNTSVLPKIKKLHWQSTFSYNALFRCYSVKRSKIVFKVK